MNNSNEYYEYLSSLGLLVIVNGIDNQDVNGNLVISYNQDLFDMYKYRQLFVMEYILNDIANYSKFLVLSAFDFSLTQDEPTGDFTLAYIEYDEFNNYYKLLFGEDFDMSNSKKGNTIYDETHVYYENRRSGMNGVYASSMIVNSDDCVNNECVMNVSIGYSDRASELIGKNLVNANIEYTKDSGGNIVFESFVLIG